MIIFKSGSAKLSERVLNRKEPSLVFFYPILYSYFVSESELLNFILIQLKCESSTSALEFKSLNSTAYVLFWITLKILPVFIIQLFLFCLPQMLQLFIFTGSAFMVLSYAGLPSTTWGGVVASSTPWFPFPRTRAPGRPAAPVSINNTYVTFENIWIFHINHSVG